MPSQSQSRASKRRFTSRERASRIAQRIRNAGSKGISVKQLASRERISRSKTYRYLSLARGKQKKGAKIERLDKKYYSIKPTQWRKSRTTPSPRPQEPQRPESPESSRQEPQVGLRGYVNYASSSFRSRDIDIDCVMLVEHDRAAILSGSRRITDIVERRFGPKLARMLKFGVSPATPESANHFLYQRHGGNWIAF